MIEKVIQATKAQTISKGSSSGNRNGEARATRINPTSTSDPLTSRMATQNRTTVATR